jgi:hypothetical protein
LSRALGGAIENGSEKKGKQKFHKQILRQFTCAITVFGYKCTNKY